MKSARTFIENSFQVLDVLLIAADTEDTFQLSIVALQNKICGHLNDLRDTIDRVLALHKI